jgi:hypothetical protein
VEALTAQTAAWQKGFPLNQLKALAAPFRERHKPLVFGAFGLTKERDVADALAAGHLLWTGDPPEACAIAHIAKRPSNQHDFAQREFTVPAGFAFVKSFAARDATAGVKVLAALRHRTNAPLVVDIFEEDATSKETVNKLALRYVATKISAGSEIKGVYSSETEPRLSPLPAEDGVTLKVLQRGYLGKADLVSVREELHRFGADHFAQHYSDYNKRKSWTSFALHGYQDDPHFIIKPAEMSKGWKEENPAMLAAAVRWTTAAPRFPKTRAVVERLGLKLDRVRFMRLRSRDGELSRHADITDRAAGTADGFICRLHIPVVTSDAVTFFGWDARGQKLTVKLPEGALCYLDQRKPHAVTNKDPTLDRTHLVVDCVANAALRKLLVA